MTELDPSLGRETNNPITKDVLHNIIASRAHHALPNTCPANAGDLTQAERVELLNIAAAGHEADPEAHLRAELKGAGQEIVDAHLSTVRAEFDCDQPKADVTDKTGTHSTNRPIREILGDKTITEVERSQTYGGNDKRTYIQVKETTKAIAEALYGGDFIRCIETLGFDDKTLEALLAKIDKTYTAGTPLTPAQKDNLNHILRLSVLNWSINNYGRQVKDAINGIMNSDSSPQPLEGIMPGFSQILDAVSSKYCEDISTLGWNANADLTTGLQDATGAAIQTKVTEGIPTIPLVDYTNNGLYKGLIVEPPETQRDRYYNEVAKKAEESTSADALKQLKTSMEAEQMVYKATNLPNLMAVMQNYRTEFDNSGLARAREILDNGVNFANNGEIIIKKLLTDVISSIPLSVCEVGVKVNLLELLKKGDPKGFESVYAIIAQIPDPQLRQECLNRMLGAQIIGLVDALGKNVRSTPPLTEAERNTAVLSYLIGDGSPTAMDDLGDRLTTLLTRDENIPLDPNLIAQWAPNLAGRTVVLEGLNLGSKEGVSEAYRALRLHQQAETLALLLHDEAGFQKMIEEYYRGRGFAGADLTSAVDAAMKRRDHVLNDTTPTGLPARLKNVGKGNGGELPSTLLSTWRGKEFYIMEGKDPEKYREEALHSTVAEFTRAVTADGKVRIKREVIQPDGTKVEVDRILTSEEVMANILALENPHTENFWDIIKEELPKIALQLGIGLIITAGLSFVPAAGILPLIPAMFGVASGVIGAVGGGYGAYKAYRSGAKGSTILLAGVGGFAAGMGLGLVPAFVPIMANPFAMVGFRTILNLGLEYWKLKIKIRGEIDAYDSLLQDLNKYNQRVRAGLEVMKEQDLFEIARELGVEATKLNNSKPRVIEAIMTAREKHARDGNLQALRDFQEVSRRKGLDLEQFADGTLTGENGASLKAKHAVDTAVATAVGVFAAAQAGNILGTWTGSWLGKNLITQEQTIREKQELNDKLDKNPKTKDWNVTNVKQAPDGTRYAEVDVGGDGAADLMFEVNPNGSLNMERPVFMGSDVTEETLYAWATANNKNVSYTPGVNAGVVRIGNRTLLVVNGSDGNCHVLSPDDPRIGGLFRVDLRNQSGESVRAESVVIIEDGHPILRLTANNKTLYERDLSTGKEARIQNDAQPERTPFPLGKWFDASKLTNSNGTQFDPKKAGWLGPKLALGDHGGKWGEAQLAFFKELHRLGVLPEIYKPGGGELVEKAFRDFYFGGKTPQEAAQLLAGQLNSYRTVVPGLTSLFTESKLPVPELSNVPGSSGLKVVTSLFNVIAQGLGGVLLSFLPDIMGLGHNTAAAGKRRLAMSTVGRP